MIPGIGMQSKPGGIKEAKYVTVAAGDMSTLGYLYRSEDQGETWVQGILNKKWTGIDISATGQYQTAVAYNDFIYRSIDFGVTWSQVAISNNWFGISISATGQYQTAIGYYSLIYRSTDFGATWSPVANRYYWSDGWTLDNSAIYCISVNISSQTGQYQIIGGLSQMVYYSYDYGVSWYQLNFCEDYGFPLKNTKGTAISQDGRYTAISTGGANGYIARIFGYYGGSQSGLMVNVPGSAGYYEKISMSQDGKFWVCTEQQGLGKIFVSSNFGNEGSWATTVLSSNVYPLMSAVSKTGKIMFVVAHNNTLYKSIDSGLNWTIISFPVGFWAGNISVSKN